MLDRDYWEARYRNDSDAWDMGYCSTPLKTYFDQLTRKDIRILIPGGGRSYEAEYLHRLGFANVFAMDLTDVPFQDLLARCPDFLKAHLIVGDFFAHTERYDLIIEQTFFCALDPSLRERYVSQMHEVLYKNGKLVGVLFDAPMNADHPPFGGNQAEYRALFAKHFTRCTMAPCYNSVPQREGRELWLTAERTA